jgi:hypothetical protein
MALGILTFVVVQFIWFICRTFCLGKHKGDEVGKGGKGEGRGRGSLGQLGRTEEIGKF